MYIPKTVLQLVRERIGSTLLVLFHIVICCVSLTFVTQIYDTYHLFYNPAQLFDAILLVAASSLATALFMLADFSFGYFGIILNAPNLAIAGPGRSVFDKDKPITPGFAGNGNRKLNLQFWKGGHSSI